MSTAFRLFLKRGRILTRGLRKGLPLTSRKKSTSTVSSSPLAKERVPLILLCHFSPTTPYRGDGSGKSKTAADGRSAVGGLSGCDCRSAGACAPGGRAAGLLHRPAAAG